MPDTVLVLNNPASVLILFTSLLEQIDELWIEKGASANLDRMIERALDVLRFDRELPVRHIDVQNLFAAGQQRRGKVQRYRGIAQQVDALCDAAKVKTLICSSTSSFRLAHVEKLRIVDHGTGDYLRTPWQTRIERLKYALLYSRPSQRSFEHFSFIPLSGRTHLPLKTELIRECVAGLNHPFRDDRLSVILLVHPTFALKDQLQRVADAMGNESYDLYLKGHHFDTNDKAPDGTGDSAGPNVQPLSDTLGALPAEILVLGLNAPLRLAAIESTALWNIGINDPARVRAIARREEILGLPGPWRTGLTWLENALGYSPFR
ncbi:hypothetical protein T7987_17085 (plasmid) [Sulfitobacter faviae]|uniref:Uncharacterized protein n=1 Tax=Sulfitobacter faviae TaxID=1775881 RepID=A0ABZ0V3Z8_9RHOB|nr:hypothetical protein [Sulfitobacter faviae]WPZ23587.1 hypothetical protein T7987_17085 [Sulfitobacter faviae]